jgi:predicted membrane protein
MLYKAKEPKFLWIVLLLLSLTYAFYQDTTLRIVFLILAVLFVMVLFSSYTLKIEEEWLIFSCYVLGIKLFQRKVQAESIKQILLIKNERQTIVLVQITNSIRLKLQRFKPITYIEEIQQFAERNALPLKEQSLLKQGK